MHCVQVQWQYRQAGGTHRVCAEGVGAHEALEGGQVRNAASVPPEYRCAQGQLVGLLLCRCRKAGAAPLLLLPECLVARSPAAASMAIGQ